jgi:GT2 family glycosyltransferase
MTITVIIPTYNRLELTQNCLASIQRHDPIDEIIIVDNGSEDGTAKIATIANADNLGFAAACNQGAAEATSDYLIFLNNDTIVHPNWTGIIDHLAADDTIGAAQPKLLYPDCTIQCAGIAVDLQRPPGQEAWNIQHEWSKELTQVAAVTGACLAIRRTTFWQVGGFDIGYWNGYEDVDLSLALVQDGYRNVYDPRLTVTHLESQSGAERWSAVAENVTRLRTKWSQKP